MQSTPARSRLAFAGAVAVGASLAIGELGAGLLGGVPSPLLAVARFIVDIQPPGAKDLVVALFGTADKLAFQVFIVLVALAVGAGLGMLAARRADVAAAILAGFAGAGLLASLRDPEVIVVLAAAVAAVEALVGIGVLRFFLRSLAPAPVRGDAMPAWSRRSLLQAGGAIAVGSVLGGFLGRFLLERRSAPATPDTLPVPGETAVLPAGASIATDELLQEGLAPIVVPNDDFYRIDTAFIPPTVDRATWRLKVTGRVDREVELTYDELIQLPSIEQFVTIACVSNNVGGNLVGNAKWTGVPLRTVLDMAGVHGSADQLVGRSVDGFTAGMPVAWVMDPSRVPMIAVGMNDEPLPRAHGYPARLIVPGLYGYVSATKWLSELELTRFDEFEGFWVPRGWAQKAPILTQSRIDVPSRNAQVAAGTVPVAGVAWAPDRGVREVQVRIDEGDWGQATISNPISRTTWVQWLYEWQATPGSHTIEVRAVDGNGDVQTDQVTEAAPDGARGHHTISVSVT